MLEELLSKKLQKKLEYSDLEIKRLAYTIKALFSELSKLTILLLGFCLIGKAIAFMFSVLILLTIRCNLGGLHFKRYWSCFLFTGVVFVLSIEILPTIPLNSPLCLVLLSICTIVSFLIGPIPSQVRPVYTEADQHRFRNNACRVLICYIALAAIFPNFAYLDIGVWVVVVQTLQLIFAFGAKKGNAYEEDIHKSIETTL